MRFVTRSHALEKQAVSGVSLYTDELLGIAGAAVGTDANSTSGWEES
jgi:hypothetical protein